MYIYLLSVLALTSCELLCLSVDTFKQLQKVYHRRKRVTSLDTAATSNVKLESLTKLHLLGTGAFGEVSLVQHSGTKNLYALKAISKRNVNKLHIQKHIVREKNIMLVLNHPFLVRLVKTFVDPSFVYLLLEFVQGGELLSRLRETGKGLSILESKFYGALITLALEHLHSKSIAYRSITMSY